MSKILVLGATGFMGRNCVEHFSAKGHRVHAVAHIRPAYDHPNVEWHFADLCEQSPVNALFDKEKFDIVIQAAAATTGCKDTLNDPAMHIAANAVMNSFILRAASRSDVKHLIFPSCSVMYQTKDYPQKESDWSAADTLNPAYLGFASTKLYCEKLCEFYAGISDTKFTVFRNTNFFGKYDKYDLERSHVFGASITKVMRAPEGGTINVWGSGDEARDFVHISDFCRIVEAAIEHQPDKYALYNCGSGHAVKIRELVQTIIRLSGKNLKITHDLSAPTIPTSLCLDTAKARDELGWHPQVGLEEGILQTVPWWKEHVGQKHTSGGFAGEAEPPQHASFRSREAAPRLCHLCGSRDVDTSGLAS